MFNECKDKRFTTEDLICEAESLFFGDFDTGFDLPVKWENFLSRIFIRPIFLLKHSVLSALSAMGRFVAAVAASIVVASFVNWLTSLMIAPESQPDLETILPIVAFIATFLMFTFIMPSLLLARSVDDENKRLLIGRLDAHKLSPDECNVLRDDIYMLWGNYKNRAQGLIWILGIIVALVANLAWRVFDLLIAIQRGAGAEEFAAAMELGWGTLIVALAAVLVFTFYVGLRMSIDTLFLTTTAALADVAYFSEEKNLPWGSCGKEGTE
ncbi:MAG: hypothetical protein FWD93_05870 [Coriobacteriia bacterium]|nr:hypothetical protein [Coriobacteriia bacterium]